MLISGSPHVASRRMEGCGRHGAIHASGLVIVFESTRGAGDANLWIATRPTIASAWSAPQMIYEARR